MQLGADGPIARLLLQIHLVVLYRMEIPVPITKAYKFWTFKIGMSLITLFEITAHSRAIYPTLSCEAVLIKVALTMDFSICGTVRKQMYAGVPLLDR